MWEEREGKNQDNDDIFTEVIENCHHKGKRGKTIYIIGLTQG